FHGNDEARIPDTASSITEFAGPAGSVAARYILVQEPRLIEYNPQLIMHETSDIGVWDSLVERDLTYNLELIKNKIIPSAERLKSMFGSGTFSPERANTLVKELVSHAQTADHDHTFRRMFRIERRISKHVNKVETRVHARLSEIDTRLKKTHLTEEQRSLLSTAKEHLQMELYFAQKIKELAIDIQHVLSRELPSLKKASKHSSLTNLTKKIAALAQKAIDSHATSTLSRDGIVKTLLSLIDTLIDWQSKKAGYLNKILSYSTYLYEIDARVQSTEKELSSSDQAVNKSKQKLLTPDAGK
ncbi:MAG: hypothetical protein ACOC32_04555, partial [Nanoarchaeota archaeon]